MHVYRLVLLTLAIAVIADCKAEFVSETKQLPGKRADIRQSLAADGGTGAIVLDKPVGEVVLSIQQGPTAGLLRLDGTHYLYEPARLARDSAVVRAADDTGHIDLTLSFDTLALLRASGYSNGEAGARMVWLRLASVSR